ncbi:NfeD family protein [Spirilliplanes yamanashiensis]|uniref:Membrane protein n=1 Tax=Spirilliplanes yamanashiensis TaxID=42233 RepID=A0A8J4DJF7_9ACTN|nr:NfeD family protein [Spirilliplanes yamanashiensis]MDP9817154.1 membrane protein implicated in regulation of membrane protease activity [Spirilliplanes yamanashiensis]GIJ03193.1 membrane protein [Spirilliplanes yamanashiensis]
MEPLLWVVLGVVLVVAEIFTTTLFLVMFAAGAFAAAAAAGLGAPVAVQAIVFAVVSALSVAVVRPVIRRHRQDELTGGDTPFGLAAIEGSEALVLDQVDADHGMVKIDGEVWTARSFDGTEVYAPGEHVRVIKVRGATALVWREGLPGGSSTSGNEA